jgi:hypothetical protein
MGGLERVAPKVALLPAAFFLAYKPASAVPKTLPAHWTEPASPAAQQSKIDFSSEIRESRT